jgi:DNA-directed RNA polymerase specialized sigma24 family protein
MSDHDLPEDHHVPPDGPALDPRVAKARYRQRTRPSSGLVYLRELTAREWAWMVDMTAAVARMHHVDADDLLQDLALSLLDCEVLDRGRTEVRSWLRNRARWRALDTLRRGRRAPTVSLDHAAAAEPPAPEPVRIDPDWSVQRLVDLGLNRSEAQAVLLHCWNLDISMRDFAAPADRSYAAVRQDRSRGLRKIENLFQLDEDESAALVACRDHGARTAARRLGIEIGELRALVSHAERKIDRALRRSTPNPTGDEDDSDAC